MAKRKSAKFNRMKRIFLGFLVAVFSGIIANVIYANHEALMELVQSPFR